MGAGLVDYTGARVAVLGAQVVGEEEGDGGGEDVFGCGGGGGGEADEGGEHSVGVCGGRRKSILGLGGEGVKLMEGGRVGVVGCL